MKLLFKAEEAASLALALLAISLQSVSVAWWMWPFLFLSPDISMLGYLHSSRTGAWTYNLFHHKGVAIGVIIAGYLLQMPWLLLAGLVLFAHSAFDRLLGFGLKYEDNFKHTHLGYSDNRK